MEGTGVLCRSSQSSQSLGCLQLCFYFRTVAQANCNAAVVKADLELLVHNNPPALAFQVLKYRYEPAHLAPTLTFSSLVKVCLHMPVRPGVSLGCCFSGAVSLFSKTGLQLGARLGWAAYESKEGSRLLSCELGFWGLKFIGHFTERGREAAPQPSAALD